MEGVAHFPILSIRDTSSKPKPLDATKVAALLVTLSSSITQLDANLTAPAIVW